MGHLVYEHPMMMELAMLKSSDTSLAWKRKLNFPDQGLSLIHQRFGTKELGNVTSINYLTSLYLLNRNSNLQLNLDVGLGMGYADTPFSFESNNKNNALSSHFVIAQQIKIRGKIPLSKQINSQIGLGFTHFSNASFKQPNNGINTAFLSLGVSWTQLKNEFVYPKRTKTSITKKSKVNGHFATKLGFHESYAGLGTKAVWVGNPYFSKQLKTFGNIIVGSDFMYSYADKHYAEFKSISGISETESKNSDAMRIGIYAGYEQLFDKISIEADFGYYLYAPFKIHTDLYQNIRFKYHIPNTKLTAGLGLKVHLFKADYATLELHYKLF
jgi:hypothetical protein